jgi:hypothetical protein
MNLDIKTYAEINPSLVNFQTKQINLEYINGWSQLMYDFNSYLYRGVIQETVNKSEIRRCLHLMKFKTNVDGDIWEVSYKIDSSD